MQTALRLQGIEAAMKTIIQNISKYRALETNEMEQGVTKKIAQRLITEDFSFLSARQMCRFLWNDIDGLRDAWRTFQDSWNRLKRDTFMADGGRYRLRRHAVYRKAAYDSVIFPIAYRPHYQSLDHNGLNGGVARYFSPIESATCSNRVLRKILSMCREVFCHLAPECGWDIEVHQFRIVSCGAAASPTPEGIHRDGVDFVFMMMVNRQRVRGGATFLYDQSGALLHQHTMSNAMESAFINDQHIFHGVSPITPATPEKHGYRDMLVITFRKA
jgi:hypothetical protein